VSSLALQAIGAGAKCVFVRHKSEQRSALGWDSEPPFSALFVEPVCSSRPHRLWCELFTAFLREDASRRSVMLCKRFLVVSFSLSVVGKTVLSSSSNVGPRIARTHTHTHTQKPFGSLSITVCLEISARACLLWSSVVPLFDPAAILAVY
jgi:hypothetical protein